MIHASYFKKLENVISKVMGFQKKQQTNLWALLFTIKKPKKKGIKPELPLVFIHSVHFLIIH